ncbi:MAG: hypothetical protein AAF587_22645 [Bacteroidota bacterium]
MAKKDLSQAPGLDALFRRPTVTPEDKTVIAPKPESKEAKPKKKAQKSTPTPPPESEPKPREEVLEQKTKNSRPKKKAGEARNNVFSVNLEAIRKNEVKYTGIRLKKDLFDRLGEIAQKEKVKSTNSLISKVLEAFCEGYEEDG